MPTDLAGAIIELRRRNRPVPRPARLPTEGEVTAAETALGFTFPADYRCYLLEASDIVFGTIEPGRVTPDAGHQDLVRSATEAWDGWGVPHDWLPFCEDNADFYCLDGTTVRFWSHYGQTDESWPDLATWIMEVLDWRDGTPNHPHMTLTNTERS
jgi:hypothetical protein